MAKLHQRLVVLHTTTQVAINTSLEQSGGAPAVGLTSPRGGLLIYRPDPPPPPRKTPAVGLLTSPGEGQWKRRSVAARAAQTQRKPGGLILSVSPYPFPKGFFI